MLENLPIDEELQKEMGLFRNPNEDPANWQARVDQIQQIYRTSRIDAAVFLALAHFENGDYGDVLTWVERARKVDAEDQWKDALHYIETRAYEAMKNWQKAAVMYRTDRSPQAHGNLLRAQMLERQIYGRSSQPDDAQPDDAS